VYSRSSGVQQELRCTAGAEVYNKSSDVTLKINTFLQWFWSPTFQKRFVSLR
jgi:hypothetical protein